MTLAHWVYALGAVAVLVAMGFRKGVVVPSLVATFLLGWAYKGGILTGIVAGLTTLYNANIMAAKELFGIVLLISFMVAMLNALKKTGAEQKLVIPIKKLMINGHVAYWVLFVTTAILSTAFWPTPAVPLVAAVLMPAAAAAGLPPMGMAIAVTLAGQGMALAADALMQVAPSLSATAAGLPGQVSDVWFKTIILTLVVGLISAGLSYIFLAKSIKRPEDMLKEEGKRMVMAGGSAAAPPAASGRHAAWLAWTVLIAFTLVVAAMIAYDIKGGDAGALIGGTAAAILLIATTAHAGWNMFDEVIERLKEGFTFAMKIMGSIIPIAAFFFMGSQGLSAAVLGENAPGFLFDMVAMIQVYIPKSALLASFGLLFVGMLTGLDGSGFSGLPLTGALAGALGLGTGTDPTALAAVGQLGAIWTGGGTLVAWSSLVAVASFAGVSPEELARKNFLPVILGLVIAAILAVILW
ncbi:MAG TPA: hypothetical protein VD973_02215 [Symbiobacteriaceae bacterium]|nr:hypothetical protein [Symbiobacteriaceae bacterium]